MQRTLAICLTLGALGVACSYAQTPKQNDAGTPTDIPILQQKRIELLQERVSQIESIFKVGLPVLQELIRAQMDLINAKLDYAQSNAEKRKLLTDLIAEYDKLIRVAESSLHVPVVPPRPGQHIAHLRASELLLLKSERVRIQISRSTLD